MINRKTYLILAIDGVLRPRGQAHAELVHMPRLLSIMSAYQEANIVLLDPLCETLSIDALREIFPSEIRHRIVDALKPRPKNPDSVFNDPSGQQIHWIGNDTCPWSFAKVMEAPF